MALIKEHINTAPADMSLIILIEGSKEFVTRSHNISIAVLNISRQRTSMQQNKTTNHSFVVKPSIAPDKITEIPISTCILKFSSE